MMFAAPPRARTGALEPRIAVAIAAIARDNFRDFFISSILVCRHLVIGSASWPSCRRACRPERTVLSDRAVPSRGVHSPPQALLRTGPVPVTHIKRGKSVMLRLIALE